MVSSGTINGDLSSLKSSLQSYSSEINGLSGIWKGTSHDSIVSQAENFASEYLSTIEGEMTAFATACDLYTQYQTAKTNLEIAKTNYASATTDKDKSSYSNDITYYSDMIKDLKDQINSNLQTASSGSLSASSVSIPSFGGSSSKSIDAGGGSNTKATNISSGAQHGDKYWQVQGNGQNCGMTSFLMAVNTLIGENKYTNNVREWRNVGSYSEDIGCSGSTRAQRWLKQKGLDKRLNATDVDTVTSKQELIKRLNRGEVVVVSAGGRVFKRNDGSKVYHKGHYICFYKTENGCCYANDPAKNSKLNVGVKYTSKDLDAFFANYHNSVAVKAI